MKQSFIFLFLFYFLAIAAENLSASQIPKELKKSVTFIFIKDKNGALRANGTGFFVSVPINEKESAYYLVTAKHVLIAKDGNAYNEIYLRMNRNAGGVEITTINFNGGKTHQFFTHGNPKVGLNMINPRPPRRRDLAK